jgi:[ribosomal protein S5]-alanine N-acetyltransferase
MTYIVTERLEVVELSTKDAEFIVALLNSPGWLSFIGDKGVKTIADAERYLENGPMASYAKNNFGLWLVRLKEGHMPIGICGLIKRDYLPHADLGFAFMPEFEGQGYAYESAAAVLRYAATALNLPAIAAITTDENDRSLRLLFRLGFAFIGMVTDPGNNEELMLLEKQISAV